MCFIFDISPVIKLSIPIVAILDTNSNPEGISFPIPGNDDARRSIDLYCNLIKQTIESAKKEIPVAEGKTIINNEKVAKKNKIEIEKKVENKKTQKPLN